MVYGLWTEDDSGLPPKYIRSIVSRLEALEKENLKLLKVIEDQKEICDNKTMKDVEKILNK